jgi:hypothetical protein
MGRGSEAALGALKLPGTQVAHRPYDSHAGPDYNRRRPLDVFDPGAEEAQHCTAEDSLGRVH